jgi:hypothetical protein
VELFNRVLREAGKRFAIEVRHLVIEADCVSFYIKPADGFMLPIIMQWIKQTFACRYNAMKRLDGHVWGDRYWSKVLAGEPPEEIPAGGTGRGDCVEEKPVSVEAGGQIPKARPRAGPPGGDSHRETLCPASNLQPDAHSQIRRICDPLRTPMSPSGERLVSKRGVLPLAKLRKQLPLRRAPFGVNVTSMKRSANERECSCIFERHSRNSRTQNIDQCQSAKKTFKKHAFFSLYHLTKICGSGNMDYTSQKDG